MHACSTFARSRWTSLFALAVLALCIGACGREPSSTGTSTSTDTKDRYDVANMKLGAPPAVVSSERHTGAFADGAALSMEPAVKPLDRTDVKEVRLDITHKIIEIAPGVKFSAWTFGDQVPGPAVRTRVGDRIKFSMTNRSDEPVPGVRITSAPMMHSMDFHSAMVARRQVSVDRAGADD